jgi:hypothetical protein
MATKSRFLADIICDDRDNTLLFITQSANVFPYIHIQTIVNKLSFMHFLYIGG